MVSKFYRSQTLSSWRDRHSMAKLINKEHETQQHRRIEKLENDLIQQKNRIKTLENRIKNLERTNKK